MEFGSTAVDADYRPADVAEAEAAEENILGGKKKSLNFQVSGKPTEARSGICNSWKIISI